jgi:hypothetical protein
MDSFSSNDPVGLFDHHVALRFQAATLRCVLGAYTTADRRCKKFPMEAIHDHRPYERRIWFDWRWLRMVNSRFAAIGAQARWDQNVARNCYHTTVRIGPVMWTASAVAHPFEIVRIALFRKTLARSNQRLILPEMEEPVEVGTPLCALLIHGPSGQKFPTFANIVFPLPDCYEYAEPRIKLFERFPKIVAAAGGVKEEVIEDVAMPQLRDDVPKTGDDL